MTSQAAPPRPAPEAPAAPPAAAARGAALAALPLALLGAVLAWWTWERGAYFTVDFYPGGIVLLLTLAMLCLFAPWPGRLRGAAPVALAALLALAAWTLTSALWSAAPVVALEDAMRVLTYGAAFALGGWCCLLLGRRLPFALAPLAGAGALIAVGTLIALWTSSDIKELFEQDASVHYPLRYRNAAAAFFIMSVFPLIGLAAQRERDWRLRGPALAGATLCIELAVMCQSRGAVFATVAGVAVLLVAHPRRWAIAAWLGLAVALALPALPWLLDVFQDSGGERANALPPARDAARAAAASTVLALIAGLLAARAHAALRVSERVRRAGSRAAAVGVVLLAVGAIVAIFSLEGGPLGTLERQADSFSAGTPDLTTEQSRYGFDLRSERGDFWRVSLDDLAEDPLAGEGAGGFRASYLVARDSLQMPEDPHSVVMLMASELGVPGLLLFGTFLVASVLAILRSRRAGPEAAVLGATALAVAAYWLVHASVEWFWSYPAITLPAAFALGAAAAPSLRAPSSTAPSRRRLLVAVPALCAALAMVPLWLSERLTDHALQTWRTDTPGAYSDLDTAAALNPLADRPHAAEAVIAESSGDRERALDAAREAQAEQPRDWTAYFLEARILGPVDRAAALAALDRAAELNPRGPEIRALRKKLEGL